MKGHLIRKAALWIAPLTLLGGVSAFAHDPYQNRYNYGNGYYGYDPDLRYHQGDERQALRQHQAEERYQYGDGWELRQHQRQERRELKRHQRDERYQFWNGWDDRGGYYNRY